MLSLMVGSVVERLVPENSDPVNITGFEGLTMEQQRVIVASSLTFLMGIFQVAYINSTSITFRLSQYSDGINLY